MQPLTTSALLVRGYRDALQATGLLDAVRVRVPPATAQLLRSPPPATGGWLSGAWLMEVAEALDAMAGREGCRRVGYRLAESAFGGVLEPLVTPLLAMYRSRMEAGYGRIASVAGLLLRGPAFVYLARDAHSGVLELTHLEPTPRGLYALWEGTLLYLHHACGVRGGVGATRVSPSGRTGAIHVTWEPPGAVRDAWLQRTEGAGP